MLKNFLKVAFRNILKHKGHSFINITGMAIGMSACLLLFLWVQDELSFDRYHKEADRIYRVVYQYEMQNQVMRLAKTPAPLGPALVSDFPWIKKAVRFAKHNFLVKCQDKLFYEDIYFTDPDIFDVFTFPLAAGNPKTALEGLRTILISEEMRNKYFAGENPIGKILTLNEQHDFKITGIFKDIPRNSHFRFHFLSTILTYRRDYLNNWGVANHGTYILIAKDFPFDALDIFKEKMPQFVEKYRGKALRDMYKMTYFLQPLTRIHLHSNLEGEMEPNRDIGTVYIFVAITLFILLIACLNYINLTTARFANRAREVGVRKILGAAPAQLVRQFLGESFLFSFIVLPLAMVLAAIFLPIFSSLSGKTLAFHYFNNLYLLAGLLVILLFVGLVSGMMPALFLSAFQPAAALRRVFKASPIISLLRRLLVVFQFTISIILIISTVTMANQLMYMGTKDLGFNKEHVVNIHISRNKEARLKYETIKYEFLKNPNVKAVSASDFFPGRPRWNMNYWHEGVGANEYLMISCIPVDYDFFETFQMYFVEGRGFSRHFPADEKSAFILNEAALKEFGWKSAVGKSFNVGNWKKGEIIGVIKDFNFNSLHHEIRPVVFYIDPPSFEYFSVRISPDNISPTLSFLKNKWQELVSGQAFVFSFLDEDIDGLYKTEKRLIKIFLIFTILAIFISCLGLLGLAAYSTEQRTKEIGIRKTFGASMGSIVLLLTKEFTQWVLISNIIAWPIAWFVTNKWLQNFAYRRGIGIWIFLLAGLAALAIALLTVSYKALKSAAVNPVDTLKYE